jgi:hypothetical protein
VAAACLLVGLACALLEPDWARALEVLALLGFAVGAFLLVADASDEG